jgi:uncharacterized tellurite resistance protein B-like protein
MLKAVAQFLALFSADEAPARPPYDEVQLSAAALIVQLARVDGAFSAREEAWLRETVQAYTGIAPEDVDDFIALADQHGREAGDFATSVEALRRRLEPAERLTLVALMWKMAMADGTLHEFEEVLVERVAELLGLAPAEAAAVREAELQR